MFSIRMPNAGKKRGKPGPMPGGGEPGRPAGKRGPKPKLKNFGQMQISPVSQMVANVPHLRSTSVAASAAASPSPTGQPLVSCSLVPAVSPTGATLPFNGLRPSLQLPSSSSSASASAGASGSQPAEPGAAKNRDDEPVVENRLVLCSAEDDYLLLQDICVMCGSLGQQADGKLISCSQCGQCYHPFCVNIQITAVILSKGWRCLECTVCEGCGEPHDEARLLLCDDCDISYHTYCLDPPLNEVPQGTWKCKWCVICVKCKTTEPGPHSLWQNNYTECGPCSSQSSCPICTCDYVDDELIIECIHCRRWA